MNIRKNKKLKYIDLFAGCGGLSLGLHNAGWKGLFAIEKSPDAFMTLQHNLIDKKKHFDWPDWLPQSNHEIDTVLETYKEQLEALQGQVDLVAGGPPCQGFSMAGRRNENDSRNKLIESYMNFIFLIRPKIIFFENVKGFTLEFKNNKEKGKKYSSYVEESLSRAGYFVKGKLVDFSDFGVPQKRTRFILVGIGKDVPYASKKLAESFFDEISNSRKTFLKSKKLKTNVNIEEAISDLLREHGEATSPDSKRFKNGIYGKVTSNYQKMMRKENKKTKILPDSHRFAQHTKVISDRFQYAIENALGPKEYRDHFSLKKSGTKLLVKNDSTPTLTTLPDDYIHYSEPRILTVREYARIQSFPDDYEIKGKYTTGGKLRTQEVPRYSQIGNAIPPLFAEQSGLIIKEMLNV